MIKLSATEVANMKSFVSVNESSYSRVKYEYERAQLDAELNLS